MIESERQYWRIIVVAKASLTVQKFTPVSEELFAHSLDPKVTFGQATEAQFTSFGSSLREFSIQSFRADTYLCCDTLPLAF